MSSITRSSGAGPVGGSTSGRVSSATVLPPAPGALPGPCPHPSASVRDMLDHLALQVADVEASAAFYVRVFGPAGMRGVRRMEALEVGRASPGGTPRLWLGPQVDPGAR